MRIALLEDDPSQAETIRQWLLEAGYGCRCFFSGRAFVEAVDHEKFDLVLIDWLLPDISGSEMLAWVRQHSDRPVATVCLSLRNTEEEVVQALEQGADDIIAQPITKRVTLARILALSRRLHTHDCSSTIAEYGDILIDNEARTIISENVVVELTDKEFELAAFLFRNSGRILSRGYILETVWGRNPDINTRTVDTHVSRLRKKLRLHPEHGWRLSAVYQHGYRLERLGYDE